MDGSGHGCPWSPLSGSETRAIHASGTWPVRASSGQGILAWPQPQSHAQVARSEGNPQSRHLAQLKTGDKADASAPTLHSKAGQADYSPGRMQTGCSFGDGVPENRGGQGYGGGGLLWRYRAHGAQPLPPAVLGGSLGRSQGENSDPGDAVCGGRPPGQTEASLRG